MFLNKRACIFFHIIRRCRHKFFNFKRIYSQPGEGTQDEVLYDNRHKYTGMVDLCVHPDGEGQIVDKQG